MYNKDRRKVNMYHYNFTNDLRISSLEESLYEAAELIQSDNVPTAEQNKSKNNNINTLKFYFNIYKDNNVTKSILNNNTREVIINFIKKFQFPNVRNAKDFLDQINDGIIIAPLRLCFRLLYIAFLSDGENGFISKKEITDFVFFNDNIAKKKNPDLIKLYEEIKQTRIASTTSFYNNEEINAMWKQHDRQLRELLKVLVWTDCVLESDGKYYLSTSNLSLQEKGDMLDILLYNEYWESPNTSDFSTAKKSYISYMDLKREILKINTNNPEETSDYVARLEMNGRNRIYYGAPGTGKSFAVDELTTDYDYKRRITFHPEYTYFDFVGGLKPVQSNGNIEYEFVAGPFTEVVISALNNPSHKCALIIEEINRSNTAAVFGDVFQLLDRKSNGISEYVIKNKEVVEYIISKLNESAKQYYYQQLLELSGGISENIGQQLFLPSNVWLYATMNSSDQGVFAMDSAFKRRWEFIYTPIDFYSSTNKDIILDGFNISWGKFATELNNILSNITGVTEDKLIGPYFLKEDDLSSKEKIGSKLLIYLWDDVVRYQRETLFLEKNRFSKVIKTFEAGGQIFIDELHDKLLPNTENGD